jgi:hypothetical protein
MVTQTEYERIIESFLGELSAICASLGPEDVRRLDGLSKELEAAREMLGDSTTTDNVLLTTAVGLVDEYVSRDSARVFAEAYEFYQSQRSDKPAG